MLLVDVLGPVRVRLGSRELKLGPARQRAVFTVLAAQPGRHVGRDELIRAVWGESAPSTAAGSVHTYMSGLRRIGLPPDVLTSSPKGYCLRLEEEALDVARFARLRTDAQRRLSAEDTSGAVTALEGALRLWRGEAFAGVPGPFAELERERLSALRLASIEQRARALLDLGEHAELVPELTELVREHPLSEASHELLMVALHRAGRTAEALEAYRAARRTLVTELGVEPGPDLRNAHQRILADSDVGTDRPPSAMVCVVPTSVAHAMRDGTSSRSFVAREREVSLLRELVGEVLAGSGRTVWIEGEPGIGKSRLLTMALADATTRGCQLAWGVADELSRDVPFQAVVEALGLDRNSDGITCGWVTAGLAVAADELVALVRTICARGPLIMVIDDLQWADSASVQVWSRLAATTRQLPLLLIAATRPEPQRQEMAQLRRGVAAREGHVIPVEALDHHEVEALIGRIVGASPGPALRAMAKRATGNPLYAKEMTDTLLRSNAVRVVDGIADTEDNAGGEPESMIAAIASTIDGLSPATAEVLGMTALLGMEFVVTEAVELTGWSPYDLVRAFDEAVSANVLVEAGMRLAFRHPVIRRALVDTIPLSSMAAARRRAAEALARLGASVPRIVEQLSGEHTVIDEWVVSWVTEHHVAVVNRAPHIAAELMRRLLDTDLPTPAQRESLLTALVRVLFRLDQLPETEARQALEISTDPENKAEMRHLLSAILYRRGLADAAIALLSTAEEDPTVPERWRVWDRGLLANFRRGALDDLDAAERRALSVRATAVATGRTYSAAHAEQTLWLINSFRRDHLRALSYVDAAIDTVGDRADLVALRQDLLDNRVFTLQNLDRLAEADATIESMRTDDMPAALRVSSAIQQYWTGRWDGALADLAVVSDASNNGLRDFGAVAILLHGVTALIAGRRDDRTAGAAHLDAAEARFPASSTERENCDFLLVAQALAAEQEGRLDDALTVLEPVLRPAYAPMMLRHQWLPDIARLALEVGDRAVAEEALAVCADEAARESVPARAFAAAARCRAMITGDPQPALTAVEHYRRVGRVPELGVALEDAATVLVAAGRTDEAETAFAECVEIFTSLSARWDLQRSEARLRRYGIHRPRPADSTMSPIERRVAALVAKGKSNEDIAKELRLPLLTVQTQVRNVLEKLGS
jgi:DNA-binding SARP family transcriptional activator/tetratricopeptide (TPR) repeat protein